MNLPIIRRCLLETNAMISRDDPISSKNGKPASYVDPNATGQVKGALLRFKSIEAAEQAYDRIS
jgi:hypothetical protein